MGKQILYWRGIIGDPDTLKEYSDTLMALSSGNYAETDLDLKKLKGHRVYSIRINKADRLLFTTIDISGEPHLLLLEVILNHDYNKSRFLKPGVLKNYLETHAEAISEHIKPEHFDRSASLGLSQHKENQAEVSYAPADYHKKNFITLNNVQQDVLKPQSAKQMLISGPPGSGKSFICLSLLADFIHDLQRDEENLNDYKVLYVTQSKGLTCDMEEMWQDLPQAQGLSKEIVHFKTYKMLLREHADVGERTFVDEAAIEASQHQKHFHGWLSEYIRAYHQRLKTQGKGKKKASEKKAMPVVDDLFLTSGNYERIYEAFRIQSCVSDGEGKKSLPFTDDEELQWIGEAYAAYLIYLQDNHKVNPAFFEFETPSSYDLVVVDEAQDFSRLQLMLLSKFSKKGKICYALDSHQSLEDSKSVRPFLLQMFPQMIHQELPASYRSPTSHILLANEVIKVKHKVVGGIADKHAYITLREGDETKKSPGHVVWVDRSLSETQLTLLQKQAGPNFALVTHPEYVKEATERFPGVLVLSIKDVKGLEFNTVLVYRLLDHALFAKANTAFVEAPEDEKVHRAKEGRGNEALAPAFNQLLTALTRSRLNLIIYQDQHYKIDKLLITLRYAAPVTPLETALSTSHDVGGDWDALIKTLIQNDQIARARELIEKKKGGNDEVFRADLKRYEALKALEEGKAKEPTLTLQAANTKDSKQNKEVEKSRSITSQANSSASENRSRQMKKTKKPHKRSQNKDIFLAVNKNKPKQVSARIDLGIDIHAVDSNGSTPLHSAVEVSNLDRARLLLKKGADINKTNKMGIMPLHIAIEKGHTEAIKLLLENGADANKTRSDGAAPLHLAVCMGDIETVQLLLQRGAKVDVSKDTATPLHYAVEKGNPDVVKLLLENGADVNQPHGTGLTPLFTAAILNFEEIMRILLENGADANKSTDANKIENKYRIIAGFTPLHHAADLGNLRAVRLLLENGANANQANSNGITPLYYALQRGYTEIIKLLVENGANVNQADNNGVSPLHYAAEEGNLSVVKLLLENGANANQANSDGITPLYWAAQNGYIGVVRLLLEKGADANQTNKEDFTPLYYAVQTGHTDVVELLLESGANANQADTYGIRPLYYAAQNGHTDVARLLHENGADANQADADGITPLYVAVQNGHTGVVALLLERGTDVNRANSNGITPLFAAVLLGREKIVESLLIKGADANKPNNNDVTPLHLAVKKGLSETVKLLLEKGADINKPDKNGDTPLSLAQKKDKSLLQLLEQKDRATINNNSACSNTIYSASKGGFFSFSQDQAIEQSSESASPGPQFLHEGRRKNRK